MKGFLYILRWVFLDLTHTHTQKKNNSKTASYSKLMARLVKRATKDTGTLAFKGSEKVETERKYLRVTETNKWIRTSLVSSAQRDGTLQPSVNHQVAF